MELCVVVCRSSLLDQGMLVNIQQPVIQSDGTLLLATDSKVQLLRLIQHQHSARSNLGVPEHDVYTLCKHGASTWPTMERMYEAQFYIAAVRDTTSSLQ